MRYKFFAFAAACVFVLNAVGAGFAQTTKNNQTNGLAALLPASDGAVTLNVQKLLSESVPQVLSGKQQMLAGINAKIDEIRDKTGLDARQFEQIAVGVSTKQVSAREFDLEPVFLARGKFNAGALIAIAKLAAKGKYREEKIGSRAVYIFTLSETIVQNNKPQAKSAWLERAIDRMINGLTKEIAVSSYDDNTLVFGLPVRVRETLEGKTRVSGEMLNLISRKPNAVMTFGANLPDGLSKFVDLDNDELGTTLDSIRQLSGAIETSGDSAGVFVAAKTLNSEQAQNLHETLQGLQMLGKTFLGGNKSADKQVYGRMIDNAKITRSGTEVVLDLQVPQSDINILLAGVK